MKIQKVVAIASSPPPSATSADVAAHVAKARRPQGPVLAVEADEVAGLLTDRVRTGRSRAATPTPAGVGFWPEAHRSAKVSV